MTALRAYHVQFFAVLAVIFSSVLTGVLVVSGGFLFLLEVGPDPIACLLFSIVAAVLVGVAVGKTVVLVDDLFERRFR